MKCFLLVSSLVLMGLLGVAPMNTANAQSSSFITSNAINNVAIFSVASSPKVADVTGHSTSNGARVQVWDSHGGANQRWNLQLVSWTRINGRIAGLYRIVGVQSRKCMDEDARSGIIQIWSCHDGNNQRWLLEVAGQGATGSILRIINVASGQCLTVGPNPRNGFRLYRSVCGSFSNQRWTLH